MSLLSMGRICMIRHHAARIVPLDPRQILRLLDDLGRMIENGKVLFRKIGLLAAIGPLLVIEEVLSISTSFSRSKSTAQDPRT